MVFIRIDDFGHSASLLDYTSQDIHITTFFSFTLSLMGHLPSGCSVKMIGIAYEDVCVLAQENCARRSFCSI